MSTTDAIRSDLRRNRHVTYAFAAGLLVAGLGLLLLAVHVLSRQRLSDQRNDRQRAAICAILANIPGHVPTEIAHARLVFAQPGQPDQCRAVAPHAKPSPIHVTINGKPSVIVVEPAPASRSATSSRPSPRMTPTPTPRATPSRSPTPRPSPSPTQSCLALHLICH